MKLQAKRLDGDLKSATLAAPTLFPTHPSDDNSLLTAVSDNHFIEDEPGLHLEP